MVPLQKSKWALREKSRHESIFHCSYIFHELLQQNTFVLQHWLELIGYTLRWMTKKCWLGLIKYLGYLYSRHRQRNLRRTRNGLLSGS